MDSGPQDVPADRMPLPDQWYPLFEHGEGCRFRLHAPVVCRLEDMTGHDDVDNDQLDLDRLSVT